MTHKLLVIDDHPETLSIIQNVLEQHGYHVLAARSGFRGLELIDAELPDLVMVDGMMPEMNGWEVVRRIREHDVVANIPIIMFSAVEEAEQKLAGFNAGADDYLTKPTEPDELIERVELLLESIPPRAAKEAQQTQVVAEQKTDVSLKTQHVKRRDVVDAAAGPLADAGLLIGVLGVRGGVGTTTIAINLAATLAGQGIPTTLVDLDQAQGHVALYLKQQPQTAVAQLATRSAADVIDARLAYADNFHLLLASANGMATDTAPSPQQFANLLTHLKRPGRVVVADLGRTITADNLPLLQQADQLILSLRPERVALAAAKRLLIQWRQLALTNVKLHPILLDFMGGRDIPKQAIENYLGQLLTAVVPVKIPEFMEATNKGLPLVHLHADSQLAAILRKLTATLVKP